jgi:DNA-binding transcriptional ArsR family regulator
VTETHALDRTFTALADGTRRGVIRLLRDGPRRASDLADELGASRPGMSRHLRVLRESGLIDEVDARPARATDSDGRERIYAVRAGAFDSLRAWLEEAEQFWTAQLDGFREHVLKHVVPAAQPMTRRSPRRR